MDGPFGVVHVEEIGQGPVLLALHQTPRSVDEFRELAPLLAADRRFVAMDLPGMGGSAPGPRPATVAQYAAAALAVLDAIGAAQVDVLGHHTGGVVAMELAVTAPGRVRRLVLSSTPFVDAAARELRLLRPPVDAVEVEEDGSHLVALWRGRQPFYPSGRPDLLQRFVVDALRAAEPSCGHVAVSTYPMEQRIGLVRAPVLCVGHDADPHAFPDHDRLVAALADARSAIVRGGMVPLEWQAEAVAGLVRDFLDGPG